MSIRFPYSRPRIQPEDIEAVMAVLAGPILTQGPRVEAFEGAFAEVIDVPRVVSCSSGTAALHLAYLALDVGPDAGVISPDITFLATANAARMCGAPVWFADVDPLTGLVTPATLAAALESAPFKVKVAVAVHLSGRACDMPALKEVADRHNVLLVEDACHAPGATYDDTSGATFKVGACAHSAIATFSFHAIKHVAAGEGGAITTREPELADRAARLRSHGMTRNPSEWISPPDEPNAPWYYEMHDFGWNYRLTELQSAMALTQLRRLDANIDKRNEIAARYDSMFEGDNRITAPPVPTAGWRHAYHLYPIAIGFGEDAPTRGVVMQRLAEAGVGSQVLYIPVSSQPYYQDLGAKTGVGAEQYYRRTLAIPMYEDLTAEDQLEIVEALHSAVDC